MVAPAAAVRFLLGDLLGLIDHLESGRKGLGDSLLSPGIYHAARFGQKEGGNVVGIHQAMAGIPFVEKTIAALAVEHIVDASIQVAGKLTYPGGVTCREICHPYEGDDTD